jgi:predicted transposase/invertase (TIGR01784 family)
MVIDLLKGFVHEPWVNELDFNTLEIVSGSYITDDLRSREDDIIWKVRYQQRWIYLYLLIEFQSTIDPFMAVRMCSYTMLLYQDLIKSKQIKNREKLPPVFPLVLYNGNKRWNSSTQLSDLIIDFPSGFGQYRPQFEYQLLDEGTFQLSELKPLKNLVAAIFSLENAGSREDVTHVIDNLIQWLKSPDQDRLRRNLIVWMKRVLFSGKGMNETIQAINSLEEIRTMLSERVAEWNKEWIQQGLEKGLEKGLNNEKTLLLRQIRRRFGEETAFKAQATTMAIESPDTLEIIGDYIIDCANGEEFLTKLESLKQ